MYIKRFLERKIEKYLEVPEIIAITGSRQTGKTTLMNHLQKKSEKSVFISFEDVDLKNLFDNSVKDFIDIYINPYNIIFIDEFHYSNSGGKNLKYIYDSTKGKKIIISGSSAVELTIKAVKYLVGRIFVFELYPLSFSEFLNFRDINLYKALKKAGKKKQSISSELNSMLSPYFNQFIKYGGYPRISLCKDDEEKEMVLKNIYNTYILRDIKDLTEFTNDYKMQKLVRALALQAGNLISYIELCNISGLSFETLQKYLRLLEKTFIIQLVSPYYKNKRTEIVKNPKVYFIDNGLRNCILNDFRDIQLRTDKGIVIENFHFSEIIKKDINVKYWRTKTGSEVDFIIEKNNKLTAIEVKSLIRSVSLTRPLVHFINKYNPNKIFIFNDLKANISDNIFFYPHCMNAVIDYK
ncbi:MAG: ATP-binding protein [Bacteroidales bacterium]|nr:ATP-binding protein [Bacteroidales bacterium]